MMDRPTEKPVRKVYRQLAYAERVARGYERPVRDRHFPSPRVATDIIAQVAKDHSLTVEVLVSQRRPNRIAHARFDAFTRLRDLRRPNGEHRFSLPHIGWLLGGRDHSTVKSGLARWPEIVAAREAAE